MSLVRASREVRWSLMLREVGVLVVGVLCCVPTVPPGRVVYVGVYVTLSR